MPDKTVVETSPKATTTKAQVQAVQAQHLSDGAKSSVITEDPTNWILTTVWPGV
ncbi:MAG: hypothetical protein ACHQRJ_00120 [Alphaproteobacteria bacterium]